MKPISVPMVFLFVFTLILNGCKKDDSLVYGTMTDQEGNIYKTITIGTQTWMAENLRTKTYRNGDSIEVLTYIWMQNGWLQNGDYRNYPWGDEIEIFGRLYTWNAVANSKNISPVGWHVPSDEEWTTLVNTLGGENVAGLKMKETGNAHWAEPISNATNESGFTAVAAGAILWEGIPTVKGLYSFFWSSTEFDNFDAWGRSLVNDKSQCYRFKDAKTKCFSVRLVKD